MRILLIPAACAALAFSGCYTQLASGGYARRSVDPAYGYAAVPDSLAGDSLAAEAPGTDTVYRPATVVVNNYWRESPYYRGYALDAWDYPGFTLGFYSTGYRSYSDPWWWNRRHGYHRHDSYHGGYHGGGYRGGGTVVTWPSGPYKSDKRIFSPEPEARPAKGRRSESAPTPAPAPEPAPEVSGPAPEPAPAAASGESGGNDDGGRNESKSDRPRPQKGKRR